MRESEKLNNYEWIVVFSLILLMATITFVTHKHWFSLAPEKHFEPHYVLDQKIYVRVEGAVESPGNYILERGNTIENALALAKPAANADLKKIHVSRKVKDGQIIKVPAIEYITIYLEGAVEHPGALVLPKGTLMEDIISIAHFKERADLSKLQTKRRLKEGEKVKVLLQKSIPQTIPNKI